MSNRVWVLGADDVEMSAIERILRDAGEMVAYAVGSDGRRVHPGNAYKAADCRWSLDPADVTGPSWHEVTHMVECGAIPEAAIRTDVVRIDHHRPGDPGYGRPPAEFLSASSIGQIVAELEKYDITHTAYRVDKPMVPEEIWNKRDSDDLYGIVRTGRMVPGEAVRIWRHDLWLIAAADHCLEAAYRGQCPGVDPDDLMRFRAESRAAFRKVPVEQVLAEIEAARDRLSKSLWAAKGSAIKKQDEAFAASLEAENLIFGNLGNYDYVRRDNGVRVDYRTVVEPLVCQAKADHPVPNYADLRGESIPELPEAACREGIPFLADQTDRDGRSKIVLMAVPQGSDLVQRFMAGEIVPGLTDYYGDPARGFAGGYYA